MSISSLGQNFNPIAASGASAARSVEGDNGLGKVAEGFSGIEGLNGKADTSFSLGNPGFGNRSNGGGFSVGSFLG